MFHLFLVLYAPLVQEQHLSVDLLLWNVLPFGIKNYALLLHWLVPELVAHSFLNCSSQLMLVEKFEESFTSSAAISLGSAMA